MNNKGKFLQIIRRDNPKTKTGVLLLKKGLDKKIFHTYLDPVP